MEGLDDDITIIKSLIAIAKGGLLLSSVEYEYRNMTEERLNYRKYGFRTVEEMLLSSKDIVIKETSTGRKCHVIDAKMSHVTDLVEKAKTSKKKKSSFHKGRSFPTSSRNSYTSCRSYSSPTGQRKLPYGSRSSSSSSQCRRFSQPINRSQSSQLCHNRTAPQTSQNRNQNTILQRHCVNEKSREIHSRNSEVPQRLSNERQSSLYSAQSSRQNPLANQPLCKVTKSNQEKMDQKSSEYKTKAQVQQSKFDSDWSDDKSSGWSTDSQVDLKHDETSADGAACKEKSVVQRTVEFVPSKSVNGLKSSTNPTSSLTITVPRTLSNHYSSDSDWSDADEPCYVSKPHGDPSARMPVPTTNTNLPHVSKFPLQGSTGNIHPLQEKELCRPLMVGGIGRGKFLNSLKHGESLVVPATPNKREAVSDPRSNIIVKLKNSSSGKQEFLPAPCYRGYQLIGDMYLSRVAQTCLGDNMHIRGLCSQLCKTDLTISACEEAIVKCGTSAKIVIMIGMTDILKGASLEDMILSMSSLLKKLKNQRLIVVTLPVTPSFICASNEMKLAVLEKFNKWLLQLNLPCIVDIDPYLYCNASFFKKYQGSIVETLSEEGSWTVKDAIDSAIVCKNY